MFFFNTMENWWGLTTKSCWRARLFNCWKNSGPLVSLARTSQRVCQNTFLEWSTHLCFFVHNTISQHNQLLWHFSGHGCFVLNGRCWKRGASTNWSLFHFVRTKLDSNSWGTAWLINTSIQRTFKTHWDIFRTRSPLHPVVTISAFKAENVFVLSSRVADIFLLWILRDLSWKATASIVSIVSLNTNHGCKMGLWKMTRQTFLSP